MSQIKPEDIKHLRESGRRLAVILRTVEKEVGPGVSTKDLDILAEKLIREGGDVPAFLNYTPAGADRPYPSTLCVSVNNEVVHGIPSENPIILKEGDIISLDIGLIHNGLVTDMATTIGVGDIDEQAQKLIQVTRESLKEAIRVCKEGARVGDIGAAVEDVVAKTPFAIVGELGGHGVGYSVHDEPYVSNLGKKGKGPRLVAGMALALEPIINEGSEDVVLDSDGYTFRTVDGKRSAHFEHTILITEKGPEIITVE